MNTYGSGKKRIPVVIVTGALGSGKTTFLRRSLNHRALASSMLLVNEAAEYGVDDLLLRQSSASVGLLSNGCLCCTVNDDLKERLCAIVEQVDTAQAVDRVIIETTGLADPTPVIATITGNPLLNGNLSVELVVTTLDCLLASSDVFDDAAAQRQVQLADVILLTKSDLAQQRQVADAKARASSFNALAPCIDSSEALLHDILELHSPRNSPKLQLGLFSSLSENSIECQDEKNWQIEASQRHLATRKSDVRTFTVEIKSSISWSQFAIWLSMLLHTHGDDILRIKGILALGDATTPILVNCVRHLVYFPEHLSGWPDASRSSRLAFIVKNLDPARIVRPLNAFANPTVSE
ncbi:CobW family GTP-binding protein [Paraburkholderia franconis]|nr:GTP-binding protein [Paraburkholderia franconis]